MLSRYPLTTLLVLATAKVDAVVLSLENSPTAQDLAIGLGIAHLGLAAIWAVQTTAPIWWRGIALAVGTGVVVFTLAQWQDSYSAIGRLTDFFSFLYPAWIVLALLVLSVLRVLAPGSDANGASSPGASQRRFRLAHIFLITTLLALFLGLGRVLFNIDRVLVLAMFINSSLLLAAAYLAQRLVGTIFSRVSTVMGAALLVAGLNLFLGFWPSHYLVQAAFYTVWLEITRYESLVARSTEPATC